MTCSVVSHDFAICNQSKPLKIKVNHKFNFPTYKIENIFETISSSSSLIIATVISTSGWSDETKIGLIPETLQNRICVAASPSVWVCRATCWSSWPSWGSPPSSRPPTRSWPASPPRTSSSSRSASQSRWAHQFIRPSATLTAQKLVWIPLTCQKYNLHIKGHLPRQVNAVPAPPRDPPTQSMLRLLDYRRINVLKAWRKMRFNRAYHSTSNLNEIFHSICFKFWGKVEPLFNNNCFHFSAFPVVHIHMAIWITGVQIDVLHSGKYWY